MPKCENNATNRNSFAALSDDVAVRKKSGKGKNVSEEESEADESSNETLNMSNTTRTAKRNIIIFPSSTIHDFHVDDAVQSSGNN
uniref:Uncharacterized protein n=1 Tax=Tanacetum cinerariifolium TaxID=118510 RepID=A0A699IB37_TANCI|nr:hypothetical protein [Tanacetum cinerariifolium]